MTIVRFNNWDEFLTELKGSDRQDRTVRLTLSLRFDRQQVPYLTMVVGYVDRTGIAEFVDYLGIQPRVLRPLFGQVLGGPIEQCADTPSLLLLHKKGVRTLF